MVSSSEFAAIGRSPTMADMMTMIMMMIDGLADCARTLFAVVLYQPWGRPNSKASPLLPGRDVSYLVFI